MQDSLPANKWNTFDYLHCIDGSVWLTDMITLETALVLTQKQTQMTVENLREHCLCLEMLVVRRLLMVTVAHQQRAV
jgi:hypothetical protein